ncbi:hypothetical protein [Legionella jamestowniensis]|uniref:Uncharacterized protein n=1 Tax=Legionella jamestowniensis TaxID=455 RepID=A0A0W0UG74_9GAMM|nr:hypothetical protein [Legionella jamestowniensis]KTD06824.1 hypothetical protein Ljam_1019 [Legionella jamestowniensis]SFL82653.1 hypothetical protein SAMN02746073_2092 [Legionella jamestowniensis DSM 19215]
MNNLKLLKKRTFLAATCLCTSLGLNLFFINNAYAYFDQGTGSLLIQSCIAFFGVMMVYLHRLRAVFSSFFRHLFMKLRKKTIASKTEPETKSTEV